MDHHHLRHAKSVLPHMHQDASPIHEGENSYVWGLAGGLVLKIRENNHQGTSETRTQEYLEFNSLTVPVPKIRQELIDEFTGMHHLYMDRIPGERLSCVWDLMSKPMRESIADQMVAYVGQLSSLTSDYIGGLDGGPIWDNLLFLGQTEPRGPFANNDELFAALASQIDGEYHDAMPALYKLMPSASPPTFTHGDLHMGSVIVRGDRIVGITGWENAGFFPVWSESAKMQSSPAVDEEWREMLLARGIPEHADAIFFVDVFSVLRGGGQRAAEMCEALVKESYDDIQQVFDMIDADEEELD